MPFCRNCGVRRALHGHRGLCQPCHTNKAIRELHPKNGTRAGLEDDRNTTPPLPGAPTAALPGTPEKVAVLAERVAHWLNPWHPKDAKPS
jgi:hypothetical protein